MIKSVKTVTLSTRDAGFEHETNDCAVKALQAVTGVPYRDAHAFCRTRLNRQDRGGTSVKRLNGIAEPVFGYRIFRREPDKAGYVKKVVVDSYGYRTHHTRMAYKSLTHFVKTHPTGRYLLWSNYHAFACIEGVLYDNGAAGARTQVTGVYEFKPSSQCEG